MLTGIEQIIIGESGLWDPSIPLSVQLQAAGLILFILHLVVWESISRKKLGLRYLGKTAKGGTPR